VWSPQSWAQLGLDPENDIHWVTDPDVKPLELFVQGKIDAFLAFPPEPQELRARRPAALVLVDLQLAIDDPSWATDGPPN